MRRNAAGLRRQHVRNDSQARRRQPGLQATQGFLAPVEILVDAVADPTGERQATRRNGLGREESMAEAAKAQPDDEDDLKSKFRRQVRERTPRCKRDKKSTRTFDDNHVAAFT